LRQAMTGNAALMTSTRLEPRSSLRSLLTCAHKHILVSAEPRGGKGDEQVVVVGLPWWGTGSSRRRGADSGVCTLGARAPRPPPAGAAAPPAAAAPPPPPPTHPDAELWRPPLAW
jgi:hypothetical protein